MSRDLILIGYSSVLVAGAIIWIYAKQNPTKVLNLDNLIEKILHTRSTRYALLAIWWWLGLHYLGG